MLHVMRIIVRMVVLISVFVSVIASLSFAHEEMQSPDEIINSMMSAQGAADVKQLDCTRITDEHLEILGDAIMEKMSGSHELHEQMDVMMGGEGSASLAQMHTAMGKNWLGCNILVQGMGPGMMGGANVNMMPMMMRMMGNYYPAYYNSFDTILIVAIVGWIMFAAVLTYFYSKRKK